MYVRYTMYLISFFNAFVKWFIGVHIDSPLSDRGHGSWFLAGYWPIKWASLSFKHRIFYTGNFSLGSHIIENNIFSFLLFWIDNSLSFDLDVQEAPSSTYIELCP